MGAGVVGLGVAGFLTHRAINAKPLEQAAAKVTEHPDSKVSVHYPSPNGGEPTVVHYNAGDLKPNERTWSQFFMGKPKPTGYQIPPPPEHLATPGAPGTAAAPANPGAAPANPGIAPGAAPAAPGATSAPAAPSTSEPHTGTAGPV